MGGKRRDVVYYCRGEKRRGERGRAHRFGWEGYILGRTRCSSTSEGDRDVKWMMRTEEVRGMEIDGAEERRLRWWHCMRGGYRK